MVKRIGSRIRKFKNKLKKEKRKKGKVTITRFLQEFNIGDKVILSLEPSVHKGMYFRRFHGKVAEVKGKRGKAYEVSLYDGGKEKRLFVNPVHLKLWEGKK